MRGMREMEDPITLLTFHFENNRNELQAKPMGKYMRNLFPFLGIKTPERTKLLKPFYQQTGILKEPFQTQFVRQLWDMNEREYQYAAIDYISKSLKKVDKSHLPLFEELITSKSWWDTVDMLAQKPVGTIAKIHPEVIPETIEGWAYSEHLWLRRSAILFQLKYKEKTDEALLYRYIEQNADSGEFFIQKAIGWALREYSKTNPQSVKTFIETHSLPSLSIREGSKYL
jgi:3-methyladenine DNA glycosylase AlkD